jgi:hypothetical protein
MTTLHERAAQALAAIGSRPVFCRACRSWQPLAAYWQQHQTHFAPCVFCGRETIALWAAHPRCERRQQELEARLAWCGADLVAWTDRASEYGAI